MDSRSIAQKIALIARDKKAQNVVILDMRKVTAFCDYFVIASGTSLRQVNALGDAVREAMEKEGVEPLSKGARQDDSGWVVVDFSSVIVHLFHQPVREFYALEHLWSEAKKVRILKKYAQG